MPIAKRAPENGLPTSEHLEQLVLSTVATTMLFSDHLQARVEIDLRDMPVEDSIASRRRDFFRHLAVATLRSMR